MHESYLKYEGYRYLKLSLLLLVVCVAAYVTLTPERGASGDTAVGYALGVLSAAIMVVLLWLGRRKRTYTAAGTMLRGWVSAHVYLGLLLLVLVPLHSGFQMGANVHGLAYLLLCVVAASGLAGVLLYQTVPPVMTANRTKDNPKLAGLLERIAALDADCRAACAGLPDPFAQAVVISIERTRIGGTLFGQLAGARSRTAALAALEVVRAKAQDVEGPAREDVKKLVALLALKHELVTRVKRDVRLKALLDLWLLVHVPAAVAMAAAVVAHVVIVFYYR